MPQNGLCYIGGIGKTRPAKEQVMWNVTLYFGPEDAARTGIATLSQPCEFYRIGETILALANLKDNDGLGEIANMIIVPVCEVCNDPQCVGGMAEECQKV